MDPIACSSCHRSDPAQVKVVCASCLDSTVAAHHARLVALAQALHAAQQRALLLLSPRTLPDSPTPPSLGVAGERVLKARKYEVGIRVRDSRAAAATLREENEARKLAIDRRRKAMLARKDRLGKAQSFTATPARLLGAELAALEADLALLATQRRTSLEHLEAQLSLVYAVDLDPLSSPFSNDSSAIPTFLGHPLPRLPTLPSDLSASKAAIQTLQFLLLHLSHLLRLLALYHSVALPLNPSPATFLSTPGFAGLLPSLLTPNEALKLGPIPLDANSASLSAGSGASPDKRGPIRRSLSSTGIEVGTAVLCWLFASFAWSREGGKQEWHLDRMDGFSSVMKRVFAASAFSSTPPGKHTIPASFPIPLVAYLTRYTTFALNAGDTASVTSAETTGASPWLVIDCAVEPRLNLQATEGEGMEDREDEWDIV